MVWVAVEYEPHEGGDVEGVFRDKDKAVAFVKSKLDEFVEMSEEPKSQYFDRPTVFLSSPRIFDKWKIEEWDIT